MERKEYSVSEAVRLIGVESHVLRYWEEELPVEIRRSAQGHRIYSEENIDTFRRVRELKEKGLQLKAIRLLMDRQGRLEPGGSARDFGFAEQFGGRTAGNGSDRTGQSADGTDDAGGADGTADGTDCAAEETGALCGEIVSVDRPEPVRQFEQILRRLMEEVVSEQNEKLEEALAGRIKDDLEEFCLQYGRIAGEAAAALEEEKRQSGAFRRALRRLFRKER